MGESMGNIRYAAVARLSDECVIAQYFHGPATGRNQQFESAVAQIIQNANPDIRPKLTITDPSLGCIHYDSDVSCLYIVATATDYPQRLAFRLLEDAKQGFPTQYGNMISSAEANSLSKNASKNFFPSLCTRYENPAAVDNVAQVQQQINEVQGIMNDNIQVVVANNDNLEQLQDKTQVMADQSKQFAKSSDQLASEMAWRNRKLMLIIILVVLMVIAVIFVPIITAATRSDSAADASSN